MPKTEAPDPPGLALKLYSAARAAEVLDVKPDRLKWLTDNGHIGYVPVAENRRNYRPEDLDAFIASRYVPARADAA